MLHSVVFWRIGNIHPRVSQSQICYYTPMFYIAAIFVKYSYTTGSWLFTITPGFIQSVSLMSPSLSNFRREGKILKSRSRKNVVNSLQLLSKRWYFPHMDRAIVGDCIWNFFFEWLRDWSYNKQCGCNELKKDQSQEQSQINSRPDVVIYDWSHD